MEDRGDPRVGVPSPYLRQGPVEPGQVARMVSESLGDGGVGAARIGPHPALDARRSPNAVDAMRVHARLHVVVELRERRVVEPFGRHRQSLDEAARENGLNRSGRAPTAPPAPPRRAGPAGHRTADASGRIAASAAAARLDPGVGTATGRTLQPPRLGSVGAVSPCDEAANVSCLSARAATTARPGPCRFADARPAPTVRRRQPRHSARTRVSSNAATSRHRPAPGRHGARSRRAPPRVPAQAGAGGRGDQIRAGKADQRVDQPGLAADPGIDVLAPRTSRARCRSASRAFHDGGAPAPHRRGRHRSRSAGP